MDDLEKAGFKKIEENYEFENMLYNKFGKRILKKEEYSNIENKLKEVFSELEIIEGTTSVRDSDFNPMIVLTIAFPIYAKKELENG